jgi:predicted transcriptional regulator
VSKDVEQIYKAALRHEFRRKLLRELARRRKPVSPAGASREMGENLPMVAYHMKYLRRAGLVELVHERPVRGSIEHFYRPVRSGIKHPVQSILKP